MSHRFVSPDQAPVEVVDGRVHLWHSRPGFTDTKDLLLIDVTIEPGDSHNFHFHPNREEIIYVISGKSEQWVGEDHQIMTTGHSVHIPADRVHATFNIGDEPLHFLAIITPASADGEPVVEVGHQEPWASIREKKPVV